MENFVRWALRASAVYDLVAFVALMLMPAWIFDLFAHPEPSSPFLFRLSALPLLMAPPVYLLASMQPFANRMLVRAAVLLRVVGAIGIAAIVLAHRPEGALAYWSFVVGDLVWAGLVIVPCVRST